MLQAFVIILMTMFGIGVTQPGNDTIEEKNANKVQYMDGFSTLDDDGGNGQNPDGFLDDGGNGQNPDGF